MQLFTVISQVGPLPIQNVKFTAPVDGPVVFLVTGSVWSATANVPIGFAVYLDNTVIGTAHIFSNGPQTHRAVSPLFIGVNLKEGSHTCSIMAISGTVLTDYNDSFTIQILY
jgi:hypothetical protein